MSFTAFIRLGTTYEDLKPKQLEGWCPLLLV